MKLTILSKCFSKMKRFALAILAVLCVGSVWADIKLNVSDLNFDAQGTATFSYVLGYSNTSSTRYAYLQIELLNGNSEVVKEKVIISKEQMLQLKNEGDLDIASASLENTGYTSLEDFYAGEHAIRITYKAFKAGEDFSNTDVFIVVPLSGVLNIKAQHNYKPSAGFSILGNYDVTAGISSIRVNYAVNGSVLNESVEATLNSTDGTFDALIALDNINNSVTYQVVVCYSDGTQKKYYDGLTGYAITTKTCRTTEVGKTVYTWTGKGDGISWKDVRNWDANHQNECVGYPGAWNGGWYWTRVRFTNSVDRIDMHGETYGFVDDGAFELDKNISVTLYNARLLITYNHFWNNSEALGSNPGPTLTLDKIGISYINEPRTEYGTFELNIPAGYKVVLNNPQTSVVKSDSTTKGYFKYNPAYSTGNSLTVQNGELYTSYGSTDFYGAEEVIISNAIWHVKHDSDKVLATQKMRFFDGPDRQARLIAAEGTGYKKMKLGGTYYIKIPATPYSTSYVLASLLHSSDTCTMNIDVSNYNKNAELVPLIQFKGTLDDKTKTAMNTMTTTASKLVVTADGVDVKHSRRAKLEWDEEKKTLYYSQNPIKGFRVIVR